MFLNRILEQKENKASGKKFAIASRAHFFAALARPLFPGHPDAALGLPLAQPSPINRHWRAAADQN
jgi:hypothetical protein